MVEIGINVDELAKIIGKDRSTLYRKLNSEGEDFTVKEAKTIANALNLNSKEATAIFFDWKVAYYAKIEIGRKWMSELIDDANAQLELAV